jgi:predicted RNA-binding protein with PUA-like domain
LAYWLLKTEPDSYSWDDLVRDKKTAWEGVKNPTALKNIRSMKKGDAALIYYTGGVRAAIGVAEIASAPYTDDHDLTVVDIKPKKKLARPVTLDEIKADRAFADWILLRIGRLSVVPVPPGMWKRIEQLAAGDEGKAK